MSGFWQGVAGLYLLLGGVLLIWSIPNAWAGYRRKQPTASASAFVAVTFLIWLIWLAVPVAMAWRRRG